MGLFDDDFYSTKVSKRHIRMSSESNPEWKSNNKAKGWSTLQISLFSSAVSAVVAVLLFSFITGQSFSSHRSAAESPTAVNSNDPFERISLAAAKVAPSVVSILSKNTLTGSGSDLGDPLGSGVIFKKDKGKAYIITNAHVIKGTENLVVVTSDGESRRASVVGEDSINDLAVIEIDDKGIQSIIDMGDSTKLRAGETVIAVGNPLGLGGTLTSGIVSYTNRLIPISLNQDGIYDWEQEVIQTDAAINEGNSGGALVDLSGHLIGINTMKISDTGVEGLSFAIPVNDVMKTVDDLMLHGKVVRPYLGVFTLDLDNRYAEIDEEQRQELKLPAHVEEGLIVLEAHGPAKEAGLRLNDVIIQLDKQAVTSTKDLRRYLYSNKKVGDTLEISFYRDGTLQNVTVNLKDKPSDTEIEELTK